MSFNSNSSAIMDQQLRVQEVCIRFADVGLYTQSAALVTVDLGETLSAIVCVLHLDNSGPTCVLNALANDVVSGSSVAITLANNFAASDVLIIKYIVS